MVGGGNLRDVERKQLIESYLPLAGQVARRFARSTERQDDLAQVAALALVQAIDRRDPGRPGALPAYVSRCVEGEVRRHLRDRASTVRLPRSVQGAEARSQMTAEDRAIADSARIPLTLHDDDACDEAAPLDELGLNRALVARAVRALDGPGAADRAPSLLPRPHPGGGRRIARTVSGARLAIARGRARQDASATRGWM